MKLKSLLIIQVILILLFSNITYSQFFEDYDNITNEDLIDALRFSGVHIIKIDLGNIDKNYNFQIIIDEYAGKDNFIKSDTVLTYFTEFYRPTKDGHGIKDYINSLRLISRTINNSFDKIYLQFYFTPISASAVLNIEKEYQRKHYWVKFSKVDLMIGEKIPLLFYGSEWDDMINGVKVPRFCSKNELSTTLDEETIQFIPHYFIVNLKLEEIN